MGVEVKTYGREVKALVASIVEEEVDRTAQLVLRDGRRECPIESTESVNRRKSSRKVQRYGARRGALRKSGRVVKFRKNGVFGAYVKFGGIVVNGVDTYYGAFVELGTPGTTFQGQKGYWGHTVAKYADTTRRGKRGRRIVAKGQRVAVEAKSFLRPANKRQKGPHLQRMKARLG